MGRVQWKFRVHYGGRGQQRWTALRGESLGEFFSDSRIFYPEQCNLFNLRVPKALQPAATLQRWMYDDRNHDFDGFPSIQAQSCISAGEKVL